MANFVALLAAVPSPAIAHAPTLPAVATTPPDLSPERPQLPASKRVRREANAAARSVDTPQKSTAGSSEEVKSEDPDQLEPLSCDAASDEGEAVEEGEDSTEEVHTPSQCYNDGDDVEVSDCE